MNAVTAAAARPIGPDMFADLLPDGCAVESVRAAGSLLTVTFNCDLDDATVAEIRDRVTSRDDADQAARAALRLLRDESDCPLAVALTNYVLGE